PAPLAPGPSSSPANPANAPLTPQPSSPTPGSGDPPPVPQSSSQVPNSPPPPHPDQPTVITKTPVLPKYPLAGLHPQDMGRMLEGESLGHFELLEYVGGGGMGAVFRAIDTMLSRTVAVKVLSPQQSGDDETRRRFQNEAQSAARLDHEN